MKNTTPYYYCKEQTFLLTYYTMANTIVPTIGMGASMILFSDTYAMTIVEVINKRTIKVAYNKTKCLDYLGDEYEILDELDTRMGTEIFSHRKSGRWVEKGQPDKWTSVHLAVGVRHHSIDPNF